MQTFSRSAGAMEVVFDDHCAVANGGLVLPMTLARRLGLAELVGANVKLGDAPGTPMPAPRRSPWWLPLWWAVIVWTTLTCCAAGVRGPSWANGCQRHRRSAYSCAASAGPTPAAWTKWPGSY